MGKAGAKSNLSQIIKLSKNDIQHFSKRHIIEDFAYQVKHMPSKALEAKLIKRSFFNPAWSKEKIIKHVEEGYNYLRSNGVTGLKDYYADGEIIKIFIKKDGAFDSAYGLHKLTKGYFL